MISLVSCFSSEGGDSSDIAGRGIANPLGAIATAALLLRFAGGMEQEARDVEAAIAEVLDRGYRTADLIRDRRTPPATTEQMGAAVEDALAGIGDRRHAYHAV